MKKLSLNKLIRGILIGIILLIMLCYIFSLNIYLYSRGLDPFDYTVHYQADTPNHGDWKGSKVVVTKTEEGTPEFLLLAQDKFWGHYVEEESTWADSSQGVGWVRLLLSSEGMPVNYGYYLWYIPEVDTERLKQTEEDLGIEWQLLRRNGVEVIEWRVDKEVDVQGIWDMWTAESTQEETDELLPEESESTQEETDALLPEDTIETD